VRKQRLQEWSGYTPALVWVKRFSIAPCPNQPINPLQFALVGNPGFAIAPFPLDWDKYYDEQPDFSEEDDDYREMLQGWIERENFALIWGNSLDLDGSGNVVGS